MHPFCVLQKNERPKLSKFNSTTCAMACRSLVFPIHCRLPIPPIPSIINSGIIQ
jgi:hypothetical protein